jgi:tRNA pseudouridine32 synthase/23S rRNA pseudouridine746 synthase
VPLHRIDRDTAGVVLFSVQPAQRGAYHNLFRDSLVHKQYQALAKYDADLVAKTKLQSWHIRNRLETSNHFMQMHAVAGESNTHTELLAVAQLADQPAVARYTLRPHTGKRHQLRAHMMGLGVPILGDAIYPTMLPERDISDAVYAPLQLLAQSVRFADPITGRERVFESQRALELISA